MQRNQNQAQFLIDHNATDLVSAKTFVKMNLARPVPIFSLLTRQVAFKIQWQ